MRTHEGNDRLLVYASGAPGDKTAEYYKYVGSVWTSSVAILPHPVTKWAASVQYKWATSYFFVVSEDSNFACVH